VLSNHPGTSAGTVLTNQRIKQRDPVISSSISTPGFVRWPYATIA
jgi:hypothetical protein